MDFWKKQIAQAQELAKAAQEKTQALAKQSGERLKVLAQEAQEKAKAQAEKARKELQNVKLADVAKNMATNMKEGLQDAAHRLAVDAGLGPETESGAFDGLTVEGCRMTPEIKEWASQLTYSTFREFPEGDVRPSVGEGDEDDGDVGAIPEIDEDKPLEKWQVGHVMLLLEEVEQIQGLRFTLCPRHMTEGRFWQIYFLLVRSLLPPPPSTPPSVAAEAASTSGAAPGQEEATQDAEAEDVETEAEGDDDLDDYINGVLGEGGGEDGDLEDGLDGDEDLDEYLNAIGSGGDDDGDAIDLEGIDADDLEDLGDGYLDALCDDSDGATGTGTDDYSAQPDSSVAETATPLPPPTNEGSSDEADGELNDEDLELDDEYLAEL